MREDWDAHHIAQQLIGVMPRFNRALIQAIQSTALEDDVTMTQVFTLVALIEEPMTASEMARRRNVSLQAVSSMVQPLVERGWLSRVRKPDDRRQYLLQPTPEGIARADETRKLIVDYAGELLEGLSQEELHAASLFIPALERIVNSIQSLDEQSCR